MLRWKNRFFIIFVLFFFTSKLFPQLPQPDHIVIVIEENHGFNQIIGNSAAPYINSLVDDTLSALFIDSHGVTHPSQPNYLWLFSGDNQGVTNDNLPTDTPFTALNLGALLLDNGKTFEGYSESLPFPGFHGGLSGAYARKHNPWVNWQDANPNGIPWNLNVPFSYFSHDYSSLPTVSFVIPNQDNDMHNGNDPARITIGDTWLQTNLDGLIQWAKTHNSLVIITFDEDDFTGANWIATLFIGEMVKDGEYNKSINHLNVLRTIEDMYGLAYAGSSGDSSVITDCWREGVTSINYNQLAITHFQLEQNYPNPFNPTTRIKYSIPNDDYVTLKVFDVLGNEVATLVNKEQNEGDYSAEFNASNLPSGIYFYKLKAGTFVETRKMILLK